MHEPSIQYNDYISTYQEDVLTDNVSPATVKSTVVQGDDLLTIHEAARTAGVSRASVLSWIRNGFIEGETSPQGWMVRAGDIDKARDGADEARIGHMVAVDDYEKSDRLTVDAVQTSEVSKAILPRPGLFRHSGGQHNDTLLAPLAEFVRDQADVVQEQAETIGWLQAELRRARQQLETLDEVALQEADTQDEAEPDANAESAEAQISTEWDFDPFTDLLPKPKDSAPKDVSEQWPAAIHLDPFSDEPDEVRMMIEETERKIVDLWDEQHKLQDLHVRSEADNGSKTGSWVRRFVSSWRKSEVI